MATPTTSKRQPCEHCPWRVGVDARAIGRDHTPEVPPLHRAEMVDLAERQGDGFAAPIMACHLVFRNEVAVRPRDRVCAGYALTVGFENLNLRMLAIAGAVDPGGFACAEPLHADFAAMLAANRGAGLSPRRKAMDVEETTVVPSFTIEDIVDGWDDPDHAGLLLQFDTPEPVLTPGQAAALAIHLGNWAIAHGADISIEVTEIESNEGEVAS